MDGYDGESALLELPPSEITAARVVELSKKVRALSQNRALNLALEREKTSVSSLKKELAALREFVQQDQAADPAATASSSGRGGSAAQGAAGAGAGDGPPPRDFAAEVSEWKEKVLALHTRAERDGNKISGLKIENEKLRQVLKRELGDDALVEKALAAPAAGAVAPAGAWRGRAQQVITLKEKVKELTEQLAQLGGGVEKPADPMTLRVQKKKLEEIEESRRERIAALEAELAASRQEAAMYKTKSDANSSRVAGMEKDVRLTNERLSVLLGKSEKDDKLVEALKKALEQAREVAASRAKGAAAQANPTAAGEIASLRAKVTGLQQQVGRQEHIIRELYKKCGGAAVAELDGGEEEEEDGGEYYYEGGGGGGGGGGVVIGMTSGRAAGGGGGGGGSGHHGPPPYDDDTEED